MLHAKLSCPPPHAETLVVQSFDCVFWYYHAECGEKLVAKTPAVVSQPMVAAVVEPFTNHLLNSCPRVAHRPHGVGGTCASRSSDTDALPMDPVSVQVFSSPFVHHAPVHARMCGHRAAACSVRPLVRVSLNEDRRVDSVLPLSADASVHLEKHARHGSLPVTSFVGSSYSLRAREHTHVHPVGRFRLVHTVRYPLHARSSARIYMLRPCTASP